MTLLAIDPGRSYKGDDTIGWSMFREDGSEFKRDRISWDLMARSLWVRGLHDEEDIGRGQLWFSPYMYGGYRVLEVVCEDFVNDPKSARGGQRNGPSECIGAIEILATQAGVPFHRQRSEALGPAKLHAPKDSWADLKHLRHEDAAYLHGYEFLVRQGRLQPAGLADTL